jgi:outer membrane receptor protein involved in Fe transport
MGYCRRAVKWLAAVMLVLALPAVGEEMSETIVVTSARSPEPAAQATGPVTVVPGAEVERAKSLDEALRRDPSFAVFRRSSSLVADPSSQGVNLRGIGPSGVSRALVLEDGVPLNDGFGGWMYWGSVPRLGIERVEIAPGASSALYGSSALGGVIQVLTRPIEDRAELELQGGAFGTAEAAATVSALGERIGASLDVEGLRTDGYRVIATAGQVDQPAWSRRAAARGRVEARLTDELTASARLAGFVEEENGGTRYTTASAREGLLAVGLSGFGVEARAFARWARFAQDRAQIQPGRVGDNLASTQRAPADEEGISVQWSGHGFLIGADARRVFGRSIEDIRLPATVWRSVSGEQRQGGAFAQKILDVVPWLRVQGAVRIDYWHNLGGLRHAVPSSTPDPDLPDRSDLAVSPRLSVLVRALSWLSLRAAAYRSFRAPTLNELYRPFQAGPVRTEANPLLGPETLLGAEAGFETRWLRATAFLAQLRDPITNATVVPNLQMRQNIGSARVRGIEVQSFWAPLETVRLSLAWTFTDARVTSGDLNGRTLPQDPRHRIAAAASFADLRWFEADLALRWTSDQFEDDRNVFRLPGFAVLDVQLSRTFAPGWALFAAAENVLDRRYLVGLQGGVATVGQPLFVRAGVRARFF